MGTRAVRLGKRDEWYNGNLDVVIERMKKIRALNSTPSVFGINRYSLKRMPFNKLSVLTKSL